MSLLTMCNRLALNVGLKQAETVLSASDREWQEAAVMLAETGDELARRVDWGVLTTTATISALQPATLPDEFSRLVRGICATVGGRPVRPLERGEWAALPDAEGVPRYFLLSGDSIQFWPHSDVEANIIYQSDRWRVSGLEEWQGDSDEVLLDEDLMVLGLIVRWRRRHGMPFGDEEAEYEQAIMTQAEFDDRSRL